MEIELITKEIKTALAAYATEQKQLDARLIAIERQHADTLRQGGDSMQQESLGAHLVKALAEGNNLELLAKSRSLRLEFKAAIMTDTVGRAVSAGVAGPMPIPGLGAQYAFRRTSGPGSTISYSRFSSAPAAGVQVEGAAKANATPVFLPVDAKTMTVAAFAEMSRQAMNDTAELQRTVDTVLRARLDAKLDAVLIDGSGTDWDGLDALATPYVYPEEDLVDAIGQGADQVLTAGYVPDAVLLNPSTWTLLRTAKDANGRYQGSYLESPPPAILGLPVFLSPATAVGEAFVLSSNYCELRDVQQVTAELGYTGTQFTANLATLLVEMRVAALYRAVGAAAKVSVTP